MPIGVDTHKHVHVAVGLNMLGARLGTLSASADPAGYAELVDWARTLGAIEAFGIEGTGSYGVGLTSFVRRQAVRVVEVNHCDQRKRRNIGEVLAGGAGDPLAHTSDEIATHNEVLGTITMTAAPTLRDKFGIGSDCAAEMMIVAGDNPQRIRSEAAFARLCGACPIPASSGITNRHRLFRGGHRQANAALYRTVIVRMRWHQPTIDYVTRRTPKASPRRTSSVA